MVGTSGRLNEFEAMRVATLNSYCEFVSKTIIGTSVTMTSTVSRSRGIKRSPYYNKHECKYNWLTGLVVN